MGGEGCFTWKHRKKRKPTANTQRSPQGEGCAQELPRPWGCRPARQDKQRDGTEIRKKDDRLESPREPKGQPSARTPAERPAGGRRPLGVPALCTYPCSLGGLSLVSRAGEFSSAECRWPFPTNTRPPGAPDPQSGEGVWGSGCAEGGKGRTQHVNTAPCQRWGSGWFAVRAPRPHLRPILSASLKAGNFPHAVFPPG